MPKKTTKTSLDNIEHLMLKLTFYSYMHAPASSFIHCIIIIRFIHINDIDNNN